ncbi:similar to Saccharomyces cerevisiae YML115C VAN1 Component of the mannan polymerase I, which contains Van1p and Mnn9p and is involved in the first steps of mannan synthesis [Maudiozyma barnettii]|nr:similar to Saccharomyces cerevisiae YML115C VAN1 Component of the mannan polymerase I, which contains Van1p and Mnn9p and is involved in the first steps of mannan synthesis [Kazachstania barnettii]
MGLLDRVNRAISKKDKRDQLPTTNNEYNDGKIKDKKYTPKKKSKSTKNLLVTVVSIIVVCCVCIKIISSFSQSNSTKGSFDLDKINIKVPSYVTKSLEEEEYYDFDFEDIEPKIIKKFDQGVEHYLITEYGSDVLTPKDNERYEKELAMLLDATVEQYDLADFRGSPKGNEHRDHILVCVPLRDAEQVMPLMFKHLMNLTYPHELIDLAFLVSDCSVGDHTLEALLQYSKQLQNGTLSQVFAEMDYVKEHTKGSGVSADDMHIKYMSPQYIAQIEHAFKPPFHKDYDKPFRSVQIFQKDFGQVIGQGFSDRHAVKVQGIRRKLMGRARNWLTANALKPYHSWVYWRDADVELCPGSVIEDLMATDYDIMVPNVWRPLPEFLDSAQPYDLNSWVESQEALKLAATLDEDDVIVEGYAEYPTWRVHLAYLRNEEGNQNEIMDLDGVGGVSILAKAKIFRSGVQFPAFTFENHAETEAFGKMAKKMGYRVGGLPHYTVWHIYEPSDDDLKEIANKEREARRG